MKIHRYLPAYCSGFDDEYANASTQQELLASTGPKTQPSTGSPSPATM